MPGSQRGPEAAAVIALGLLAAPWIYRHYYADKHRHAHTRHTVSAPMPCLVAKWGSVWRVHPDGRRSFVRFPTDGCVGRARQVEDLDQFPKNPDGAVVRYELSEAHSRVACTLPCSVDLRTNIGGHVVKAAPLRPVATAEAIAWAAPASEPTTPASAATAAVATAAPATAAPATTAWLPPRASESALAAATAQFAKDGLAAVGGGAADGLLLGVRRSTGTVDAVSPVSEPEFSYTLPLHAPEARVHWAGSGPQPRPLDRTGAGFHHLGDVTLRVRDAARKGDGWRTYSTVHRDELCGAGGKPAATVLSEGGRSFSADATACVRPAGAPLTLKRSVAAAGAAGGASVVTWELTNTASYSLEVGAFGASMPFNQMFTGRRLENVAAKCSFTDVYVGGGAGYVQVSRASGGGPVLLVLPGGGTGDGFEGWRPLKAEDRASYDWMHEMLYEVLFHTAAYAKQEWRNAQPWNAPTSAVVAPGATRTWSVRLQLAPTIEGVPDALLAAGLPVARPLPSATLHTDLKAARLELLLPSNLELRNASAEPPGALAIATRPPRAAAGLGRAPRVQTLALEPRRAGRATVTLAFANGLTQTVHFQLLAPAAALVRQYGVLNSRKAWLSANASDPWRRGPAFMGYDASRGGSALLEEPRVFMGGLSDEAGAAAPLAMAMKQLGQPAKDEVAKLEAYVHETVWAGPRGDGKTNERRHFLQGADYSVRASMLYWSEELDGQPERMQAASPALWTACHKCWPKCYWMHCWSEKRSLETWRSYNYPHVAAVYWSLYRLARFYDPPLATRASWQWYLTQAARTAAAMWKFGGKGRDTSQWGLMVGSVFALVLRDAEAEGLAAEAAPLREMVERRMAKWLKMPFPYGSEFPWDSTGHEEINTWLLWHGHHAAANKTVGAILAYSSYVPHWAHCGSARRYWDFTINGKTQWGNEREFHHYGSTLNAIPLFDHFRAYPQRAHLLLLGSCALLGHLTNIDESGAASMAWHGDPGLLRRDEYSGDYGVGFYGYWRSAGAYLACVPPHGWVCTYCDLEGGEAGGGGGCETAGPLRAVPRDAFGRHVYIGPLGVSATVEAARIVGFDVSPRDGTATLRLRAHEGAPSATAMLRVQAERVYPPPPAAGYVARCAPQQPCVVDERKLATATGGGGRAREYTLRIPKGGELAIVLAAG